MNTFNDTKNFATKVANLSYANLSQKEEIKEAVLQEIALSCLRYKNIPEFREEMDQFITYQRMKEKYK